MKLVINILYLNLIKKMGCYNISNEKPKNIPPLIPGTWIPIKEAKIFVGLGWDFTKEEEFDLDSGILAFGEKFVFRDNIYYGKEKGLGGSVVHLGDNRTGKGKGDDEIIKINLSDIPSDVYYLTVSVHSYTNNSLIKAKSAYIRIYTKSHNIGQFTLTRTKDCIGLLLGVFQRNEIENNWYFRCMADPISGNTVVSAIEDIKALLGNYIVSKDGTDNYVQHPLPGEPLFDFGKWKKLENRFTFVGIGWDIQQGSNFDLDASIITFDSMNNLLEIIYHKNLHSSNNAIEHCGDNKTGIGEGDDEVLSIDFGIIDQKIFSMAVIINSFKGNSLIGIKNAFIRLYDQNDFIGVHVLNDCPESTGLILGIFRKDAKTGFWFFCPVKEIISGIEAPQSVNDVKCYMSKNILLIK